ncbi:MAG: hypothetical protein WAU91_16665 [Desulfatitalea sp.]
MVTRTVPFRGRTNFPNKKAGNRCMGFFPRTTFPALLMSFCPAALSIGYPPDIVAIWYPFTPKSVDVDKGC